MTRIPRCDVTTKPLTAFSETAARLSFAAATIFLLLFAALHVLKPEVDPSWRFISEYQIGRHGWVMSAAFLALAVSAAGLLAAVCTQVRTVGGYFGLVFLAVATAGYVLAAANVSDPIIATQATRHGMLHSAGAALGGHTGNAALFLGWALARNTAWAAARRYLFGVTVAVCGIGAVAAISMSAMMAQSHGKFGPGVAVGWPNRVLILTYAGWLLALSLQVIRQRRKAEAG